MITPCSSLPSADSSRFAPLRAFQPSGDLWTRLTRNYTRLEEEKYWPENIYQKERQAERWPGDMEGRTLLSWVLLARATGREPRYLEEFLAHWPQGINERGYFGRIYDPNISEQQLSGHGWMLRALAECHAWRPELPAGDLARPIIENLFLPITGAMGDYSIDPAEREEAGEFSGSHLKQIGRWVLSTDVGCFAIGMAGVIDAFEAFGDERLVPLIEEMVARFLEIDLIAIKAQTHATLSACRGFLKWAELRDRPELIRKTTEIYRLYTETAWTETYANYNWFERPQWTEPCAIVDALMVAMDLWRHTGQADYLEQAQLMYFNGLGHGQRANGGFGCDNCPGADGETDLFFRTAESHWCCTMRGSEGLARLAQYQVAEDADSDRLRLPFGLPGSLHLGDRRLRVTTQYPHAAGWHITNTGSQALALALFIPSWITLAEEDSPENQWLEFSLDPGQSREIVASQKSGQRPLLQATNRFAPESGPARVQFQGPLLLADYAGKLEPIFTDYLRGTLNPEQSRKRLLTPMSHKSRK